MEEELVLQVEPIENEDGSLEWLQPEGFTPVEIPEQDLEPVEVDEDYSPPEEDSEEDDG